MIEWISVKDRLPNFEEAGRPMIVWGFSPNDKNQKPIAHMPNVYFDEEGKCVDFFRMKDCFPLQVSHWAFVLPPEET